jgi:hypothetical protein
MDHYIITVEYSDIQYGKAYLTVEAESYEDALYQYQEGNYDWIDSDVEETTFDKFYDVVSVELDEDFANG